MRNEIILIGPMLAGKTTTALILSDYFKLPIVCLDEVKWKYFSEYGLTSSHADDLLMKRGVHEMINYYKPYEAIIVEKILSEHAECIFDFGAGFNTYDDKFLQNKINNILFEYHNIFLVLPTDDTHINIRVLGARLKRKIENDPYLKKHYQELYDLSNYFLQHPANKAIGKHIIYTHNASKTTLIQQVIRKLSIR